jgi:3-hydroxyisobutyrate dehydrogenase-like beta-hydroxyacid dehydrogenase
MPQVVSVLGLGNMGSILAATLVDAGHTVTVWNRSADKAAPLVARGASVATTAAEAVRASPVTIACVARYDNLYDSLAAHDADALDGRTLINVSWGTPADAQAMDGWVREHGGRYLDGGIPVYPSFIGKPDTELVYAGPPELWMAHAPLLRDLGGESRHVGEGIGDANVVSLAMPGAFYHLAYGAFLESAAYAASHGVPVTALGSLTRSALIMLRDSIDDAVAAISSDDHDTDQATLWIQLDAMAMVRDDMDRQAQEGSLLRALIDIFERGVAAGHQDKAYSVVFPMLRDGG